MDADLKPRALSIAKAAEYAGLSKSQFRRLLIDSGRIRTVPTGKRDRIVLREELDEALDAYVAEQRKPDAEA